VSAETLPIEAPATIKIADQPIVADRSTLEPYLECPLGGRLKESLVKSVDKIAATGNEVHRAVSAALVSYVDSYVSPDGVELKTRELRDIIESESWASRADVQPDAVKATKYAMYTLASIIGGISPQSILAFDGGEDSHMPDKKLIASTTAVVSPESFTAVIEDASDVSKGNLIEGFGILAGTRIVAIDGNNITMSQPSVVGDERTVRVEISKRVMRNLSGQLELDIEFGTQTVRLTAEMDLLHSTKTPGLLRLLDWKSGHATHTEATVEDSFQFQSYSLLVLETFQDIDALDVVVVNTRKNDQRLGVRFRREDVGRIRARVMRAIGDFMLNRNKTLDKVEARPSREACRLCSAAALCSICDEDIRTITIDPASAVDKLYALKRSQEEIEKTLKSVLNKKRINGDFTDIVSPSGGAFGYGKPKRVTAAKAVLYGDNKSQESDDSEE
jgi:hypothetical protein